jgi:hypothetical protein
MISHSCFCHYQQILLVDFEYDQPDGELPVIRCMVARELRAGRTIRLWAGELYNMSEPPFSVGSDVLFVCYYATAELNCFRVLGWPMPERILDLYVEFRNHTNGYNPAPCRNLLSALTFFGCPSIDATEKEDMRQLALRGGEYTAQEKQALLDYCESDVAALSHLIVAMASYIDLPRALLRGRYMVACSAMETTGIPIDVPTYHRLKKHWNEIQRRLIQCVDAEYGVYEDGSFRSAKFEQWLQKNGIAWPRLPSEALALDCDTFRQMAKTHLSVAPLHELRQTLSALKLFQLPVGCDGRNRCMLSPFSSVTGRNQPSNTKFIFGPATWLRGLIKPSEDQAIAYIDWSQQEFGIAAKLSNDEAMMSAYNSGDPYLTFGKQAGAIPQDGTKATHGRERELYKQCVLAVQYGMGDFSLSQRVGEPRIVGRQLLQMHRETYPDFWKWSSNVVNTGLLGFPLTTVFGWRRDCAHVKEHNPRSLANFPVQANGAEMLRLACCLATERGIKVCAPVHDAILIEAPVASVERVVAEAQECLEEASRTVLDGFTLRSEANIVCYPDRYMDERGEALWGTIMRLLDEIEQGGNS